MLGVELNYDMQRFTKQTKSVGNFFQNNVLMREDIFSKRIIRVWNSLPPNIVSFKSLSFKNFLDNVNLGVYIPNTDRRIFILFLLSMYLVFSLRLILCVLLLYACFCWLCGM